MIFYPVPVSQVTINDSIQDGLLIVNEKCTTAKESLVIQFLPFNEAND